MLYFLLCSLVVNIYVCGSQDIDGFELFRREQDMFTNLKCYYGTTHGQECSQKQKLKESCSNYNAECVNSTCEYCRCLEGNNTFIFESDPMCGKCISDEKIVPESAPKEAFWLKNRIFKCVKSSANNYVIKTHCYYSNDRTWIMVATSRSAQKKLLINVKTLKCVESQLGRNKRLTMAQCWKESHLQEIECQSFRSSSYRYMTIKWSVGFLNLNRKSEYAFSRKQTNGASHWFDTDNKHCQENISYKGCYRFSNGSFMKYLNYSEKNPKLQISAPIFKENDRNCKVEYMFEYTRDGCNWTSTGGGDSLFSIERETNSSEMLTIESMYLLKQWNGSLVKLKVSCHQEQHCVLLKLQTFFQRHSSEVPPISSTDTTTYTDYDTTTHTYTDQYSSSHTSTDYSSSSTTAISTSEHTTEKEDTPSVTSTTGNSNLGLSEESSGKENSNVIPISVTITLLLAALAVAIGVLVYYRRRKRTQVPQNNANNFGVVNYNKEIYEDPDRNYERIKEDATSSQTVPRYNGSGLITNKISPEYETLKENGYEVSFNRPGTSSGANTHVNTDIPRKSEETKMAPVRGPELYHTLEQPPSDDLYNYIDDTKIKNPSASPELEYTYSKDTDIPKNPRQRRVAPKEPELYHTLEQPPSDDFYNYIDNTKIKNPSVSPELEYTYSKDTDIPKNPQQTKVAPNEPQLYHTLEQPPSDDFYNYIDNTKIKKPSASPELEYTYSKDTGIPKNPQQTKVAPKGPAVYETLENPSSDDVYNYIDNTNIAKPVTSEQEYTYATDTNLPRAGQNGKRKPTASDAVYHTLEQDQPLPSSSEISSEMEYSYAKSTDLPRKPSATNDDEYCITDVSSMGVQQNNTGSCAPPTDNDLYHTLEEPNQPNVPVYSTLEEGDAENA